MAHTHSFFPIATRTSGILLLLITACGVPLGAAAGFLRAGAAKIEITDLAVSTQAPSGKYEHEHLFIRAIVVDDNASNAALITADMAGMNEAIWKSASQQIASALKCPVENILISATHTHSAFMPTFGPNGPRGLPDSEEIAKRMLNAVLLAKGALQEARIGFARGSYTINVNRDAIDPETRLWNQGPNLDAYSDKTVAVVTFFKPDGRPIAVYVNYAMHPINFYLTGIVSSDFPGAACRYVEQAFDDKAVVEFAQGASGDQNPLYLRPYHEAMKTKQQAVMATGKAKSPNDVLALMMAGDPAGAAPLDAKAADRLERFVDSEGALLGEEIIRVMNGTKRTNHEAEVGGSQKTITCPGRRRTNSGREGSPGTYTDGDPVHIRLGVLKIGPLAFASVNAEVYSEISRYIRQHSPDADTVVVTLANGSANSGYIPTDAAFGRNTFQVLSSSLKPGCAEAGIENGILDMLSAPSGH